MPGITRFVWLALVNVLGFFTLGVVFYAAYFTGTLPEELSGSDSGVFFLSFFGGTIWAWLVGLLISAGYLFSGKRAIGKIMFWAPVYVPALYSILALIYFN